MAEGIRSRVSDPGGDGAHCAGYQRDERRLIRIAPRQMAPAGQEIQLVAVVSVAAGDDDEEDGHESTNGQDRPSCEGCDRRSGRSWDGR
jgi:hypothetical protein